MHRTLLLAFVAIALLGAGVALAATPKITGSGVGAVKLHKRYSVLHAAGLLGRLRAGCELAGPNTRIARLRAPLKGTVELTKAAVRRVSSIQITGGAKARGVAVGGTLAQIKAAYPSAHVDHSTDSTFGFTRVHVFKAGGGPMSFAVDTTSHKITVIGVPELAVCE